MAAIRKFADDDAKLNIGAIIVSRSRNYRDIDLSFELNTATGDIFKKRDANAVKTAIRNLILTDFYERPFQPFIGSGIRGLLFELANDITNVQIEQNIRLAIENFEPRARILSLDIESTPDQNAIIIRLEFQVISTNEPVILELTLNRVR